MGQCIDAHFFQVVSFHQDFNENSVRIMYMNQQDVKKILVIRLYFPLDALHVSDYISPSSEATFFNLYIPFGISDYIHIIFTLTSCFLYFYVSLLVPASHWPAEDINMPEE